MAFVGARRRRIDGTHRYFGHGQLWDRSAPADGAGFILSVFDIFYRRCVIKVTPDETHHRPAQQNGGAVFHPSPGAIACLSGWRKKPYAYRVRNPGCLGSGQICDFAGGPEYPRNHDRY